MSKSSSTSDDRREALLETLQGYKVRTAPSQLFPGQCGVVALAPIAKGESVFPCNGELSNDVINLTFEEVASLPSHSRKLVWAFFQPNQDPRSVPREELTFPVPVNGLVHAGNSFFCNSADGTGQNANVETGVRIDGSGYAELVAMRDIQVGEELLDSYPIWNYGESGEFLAAVGDGVDAVELVGFGISPDEAQEILDLRRHMASLKAKVARLEELRVDNEGQIAGLKRQVDTTSSDNCQLKTKMARLVEAHRREIDHLKVTHERAISALKTAHEREVAGLERQTGVASSNSRLWWGCVNRINGAGRYRDTSTTESESEGEDLAADEFAHGAIDYQSHADGTVDVDVGMLCLDNGTSETAPGDESNDTPDDSSLLQHSRSLKARKGQDDGSLGGIGTVEDAAKVMNQDDDGDDFPPPPPLPGQVVDSRNLPIASAALKRSPKLSWNERLEELREYKEKNGHCKVPQRQGSLGGWVTTQRSYYRKKEAGEKTPLTDERVAALDAIGFQWSVIANDECWHERLDELREYKEEEGNCNIPQKQGRLGRWVAKQRKLYRKREDGEQTPLTDERVAALESIGFVWDGSEAKRMNSINTNDGRWNKRLGELRKYREKNRHCNVPESEDPLGIWVKVQRSLCRKREKGEQNSLTDDRVAALDEIGFEWVSLGTNNPEKWDERLSELREYREENGHCNVPRSQGPLGKWVKHQRYLYRKREAGEQTPLTEERVAALDAIGLEWDGNKYGDRWHERLCELRDYKEQNGHCNVPQSQGPLGRWVRMQRYLHQKRGTGKKTPLTDERVAALDAIGLEWDSTGANK